jgi:hypothetical protein
MPRLPQCLRLPPEALSLVRVRETPSSTTFHHLLQPASIAVVLAAIVRDASRHDLVGDGRCHPEEDTGDFETDDVAYPFTSPPDLFQEGEGEVVVVEGVVTLDVSEADDANNADDDAVENEWLVGRREKEEKENVHERSDDVDASDRGSNEEVGEAEVEDEGGGAERSDEIRR